MEDELRRVAGIIVGAPLTRQARRDLLYCLFGGVAGWAPPESSNECRPGSACVDEEAHVDPAGRMNVISLSTVSEPAAVG